jgi:hypothetical protein
MSLEARIELLTSAIIELTAAIGGMQAPGAITVGSAEIDTRVAEVVPVKELPNEKPSSTDTISGQLSALTGESSSRELDYDMDVKTITLALSKAKGPEVTKAILAKFDVTSAKQLVDGQWADYIEACNGALQ